MRSVELGFDIFSGSYPFVLTQRGQAISFRYLLSDNKRKIEEALSADEASENNRPQKRQKLEEGDKEKNGHAKTDDPKQAENRETFLNLSDRKYIFLA